MPRGIKTTTELPHSSSSGRREQVIVFHSTDEWEKLLSKLEDSQLELATCQEDECVICISAKATMETAPCGHQVVCRKCFVKTIQIAVSQRLLPLRCVICRAKILRLKTGPILPSSVSGYSVNSHNSVPQSDSLYSVSSGGSSISSTSSASECGSRGPACCGGQCLGAYPRQSVTGAIRRSQHQVMKMSLQEYCRPDRGINRLPPIRELPGASPSHNEPPASTRIRCAQKIVTQLESVSLLRKSLKNHRYKILSQDDDECDEVTNQKPTDRNEKIWPDREWSKLNKNEERIDNQKNEYFERQMELKEKPNITGLLRRGKKNGSNVEHKANDIEEGTV